jgi:putative inorganic carbon (HCO3(-)) transporter
METADHLTASVNDNWTAETRADSVPARPPASKAQPLAGAYLGLLMFVLVYFARPEDWIPGLGNVPLAKISVVVVLLALGLSIRQFRQRFPREVIFLFLLVGQLFAASLASPVWRGGAFQSTLGFAKVLMIVPIIAIAVTTARRLRLLIFTQAISVAAIAAVVIWKGRLLVGRLEGILGGEYTDPNDLALAIILSLPLCLALLFLSRNWIWKTFWSVSMLVMTYAIFLTGSRGGFVALLVVTVICLWEFGIRGRRAYLLPLAALAGVILWHSAGGMLAGRLKGTFDVKEDTAAAYSSAQSRRQLFWRSVAVTEEHPLFGVGPGNFEQVSGQWHTTHNTFTLMSSEGGLPALLLYVLMLGCGFRNLTATMRLARGRTELSVLARALYASLSAYIVGSLFLSWAYLFLPYILVAYTTALWSIARKSPALSKKFESDRQKSREKKLSVEMLEPEMSFFHGSNPFIDAR